MTACDHITGFVHCTYPQYGEQDYLVRASDDIAPTEAFSWCPLCGARLNEGITWQPTT